MIVALVHLKFCWKLLIYCEERNIIYKKCEKMIDNPVKKIMVGSTMIMVDFTNYGGFKEDISTKIIFMVEYFAQVYHKSTIIKHGRKSPS